MCQEQRDHSPRMDTFVRGHQVQGTAALLVTGRHVTMETAVGATRVGGIYLHVH